jgi:hypothetical protein
MEMEEKVDYVYIVQNVLDTEEIEPFSEIVVMCKYMSEFAVKPWKPESIYYHFNVKNEDSFEHKGYIIRRRIFHKGMPRGRFVDKK